MAPPLETFRIWQWNCRGFSRKKAPLQQYLRNCEKMPQVILLQETLSPGISMAGFCSVAVQSGGRGLCTLVSKKLTHVTHDLKLAGSNIEYIMVEVIPGRVNRGSIYVLNIYSSPNEKRQRFKTLLRKAIDMAGSSPLIVAGDFNAPFHAWGYNYDTNKGKHLWQNSMDLDLTLITDPNFPTRIGTSTCRDSTPDLIFVKNVTEAKWNNLAENLGSDHYICEAQLPIVGKKQREFSYTDWDKFRKLREERPPSDSRPTIEQWMVQVQDDVRRATSKVCTDLPVEKMDSRLAHLLQAKQSILNRWKCHRLNRRLRKKISELNKHIEEHCATLSKQQWDEVCNSIDGQMRNGKTWNLLKHLLNETNTKSNQRHVIARTIHEAARMTSEDELIRTLANKYLPVGSGRSPVHLDYQGQANSYLDAEFGVEEIRSVLHGLNGRSAPGPDGISNKALRNLDEKSIAYLTEDINEIWRSGTVPLPWKTALAVLIPKPGKTPSVDNLRPISLTSCVGKVAEHAVLNRLSRFLENNEVYPHSMIGFRPGLSTQDTMKLIKNQIIDNDSSDTRAILGLDLEKAFDSVLHSHILASISRLNLGERFYNYVRSFLSDRKATIRVADLESQLLELGERGTPQGSVISPCLFNIAMVDLSRKLLEIEGIKHTMYADDITIWCTGGNDGQVEGALQEAIDTIETYLEPTGLRCSPLKSELLLYSPKKRGPRPKGWTSLEDKDINLCTKSGCRIPKVDSIKVLGMIVESGGTNGKTIRKLITKTESAVRLVRRVSNRHHGLKEDNLIRLMHAFVLCHFRYVAAMHRWKRAERDKLNAQLRKITKRVLGLPVYTCTERLLQLGIHNTLEEIAEAQERAQLSRLTTTKAGRSILQELGYHPDRVAEEFSDVPPSIRENITVAPIPRNMHPDHNRGRRRARAANLLRQIHNDQRQVSFVDAASCKGRQAFTIVTVDGRQGITNAASVRTRDSEIAEQMAIALALLDSSRDAIYSDSRSAVRAFEKGTISKQALRLLGGKAITHHFIYWFPAHQGQIKGAPPNLNESAHGAARELAHRATLDQSEADSLENRDTPSTYNEITKHYYLSRRTYFVPHPRLNRAQALTLRLLQTNTYPNPSLLNKIYPDTYTNATCHDCGDIATLDHMLWRCARSRSIIANSSARWEAVLRSPLLADQLWAVQQAHDAAERLGLPVPTWERPAS